MYVGLSLLCNLTVSVQELGEALIQGLHTNDKSFEDRVKGIDSE
jgi:hypothetical protein